ncbi:MAG: response regulator [Desulfobacter sp.]
MLMIAGVLLYIALPLQSGPALFYAMAGGTLVVLACIFFFVHRIKRLADDAARLVDQGHDLLWALDANLNITEIGGGGLPMAGRRAQDLRYTPLVKLLAPDASDMFTTLIRENRRFSMEGRICRPDGSTLDVEISGQPVQDQPHTAYQGVVRDISARKQKEQIAEALGEKLERYEKLKNLGLLAGNVAHDLNNILSGIATYPEILLMDDTLDPNARKGLTMIKTSGRKASSVVSDLLTISRGARADKVLLNINTVIERYMAATEFETACQAHPGVEMDADLEPELLGVKGSYIHIEKAVMHLIHHAIDAAASVSPGRVTLSTANHYVDNTLDTLNRLPGRESASGTTPELASGEYVMLSVTDNGPAIPDDCLDKIFEPFYVQKEMERGGTGLGLTVVENAVQDHKGEIVVVSDSSGTRFELFFPAVRDALPNRETPGSLDEIRGNGETLLIVDDLDDQRKIAATILKDLGYTVFTAASGMEAVDFVKKTRVDLLVLDMVMAPAISGLETYRRIKDIYPEQKAIIASGYSESDDVASARELGAGSFVRKPYTIMDMGIAVKEELEK